LSTQQMLIRRGEQMSGPTVKPQGSFTGEAEQRAIHVETEPHAVRVSFVHFQPGAATHWHTHSGGQVLHVVEGEARVQSWGEEVQTLRPGDTITTAPDEKHWHGAAETAPMTHLAVTVGEVSWLEPPEPG
jgi:quercetin dioxygenase-like cupin family protein